MIDLLGTALGLAPFAEEAIRALVGRDAHANLIKLVERDLRASHRVPAAQRERIAKAWSSQRVDPELGGHLVAWLATGREEYLEAAGRSRRRNSVVRQRESRNLAGWPEICHAISRTRPC